MNSHLRWFRFLICIALACLTMGFTATLALADAEYLVSDRASNQILRYRASDGAPLDPPLVDDQLATNGGLFLPVGMTYGFDNDLFVASVDLNTGTGQVLRYDADSGSFESAFATGLEGPGGIVYHAPSNTLLVGSMGTGFGDSNKIYRFAADGSPLAMLMTGPISGRTGMVVDPQGNLLASSFAEGQFFSGSVQKYAYDVQTQEFAAAQSFAASPALFGANGMVFDSAGDLLVASLLGQSVVRFDLEAGSVVGSTLFTNGAYPSGVAIGIDGQVLMTSLGNNNPNDPIYGNNLFPGAVFKHDAITGALVPPVPFIGVGGDYLPTGVMLRIRPGLIQDGDFNNDAAYDCADVDGLVGSVAAQTNDPAFDMTGDGLVNRQDLDKWLREAGDVNLGANKSYLPGDANLDGVVDGSDFGFWNANKFTQMARWCAGDFNANGSVDGSDFGIWNAAKFTSSDASLVPEPGALGLVSIVLAGASISRKNGHGGRGTRDADGSNSPS